jgi:hypothetical protein
MVGYYINVTYENGKLRHIYSNKIQKQVFHISPHSGKRNKLTSEGVFRSNSFADQNKLVLWRHNQSTTVEVI